MTLIRQSSSALFLIMGVAFCVVPAFSQIPGTNVCACTPKVYEFTLDFSLGCNNVVDLTSGGISQELCSYPPGAPATDFVVPVEIQSIVFDEFNNTNDFIKQEQQNGPFYNGDKVTYTSISSEGTVAPAGFAVKANALNGAGQTFFISAGVVFSNDCGVYPVLTENDKLGWFVLTSVTPPDIQQCPGATFTPPSIGPGASWQSIFAYLKRVARFRKIFGGPSRRLGGKRKL